MFDIILKKITKNGLVKLICLIAALLLWFYNNYSQLPEKYFSIPLKTVNLPDNLAIAETFPNTVTLKLKGSEEVLRRILAKDFKIEVDLKNAIMGKNVFSVRVELEKKISRVRIISVEPNEINLKMDKLFTKEVPVSITLINSPLEGYIKTGETYTPKTVVISGPFSIVNELDVVRTKPIDIGGVTGSIYKEVELDLPAEFLSVQNYKRISVNIAIQKNFKAAFLKKVKIFIKDLNPNLKINNIEDLYADVRIEGPAERLITLDKEADLLFVDLSDIDKKDSYKKKIRYHIPWNCIMRKIEPDEINIKIEEK